MKKRILELHKTGKYTNSEIAKIVGCSQVNVGYHVDETYKFRIHRKRSEDRKKAIQRLKEMAGGKCIVCHYDKCLEALDFHHLDPKEKEGRISVILKSCSYKKAAKEVTKCVLLCCRCHREFHAGMITISQE